MHVLWLIPDYYSFLREELEAVAPLVERLSVISQAVPASIPGVHAETIPADRLTPRRIVRRVAGLLRTVASSPWPRTRADVRSLRRLARHNEFIADYVRREKVDIIHSHFAVPEGTAGWQAADGRPVILTLRGVDILTVHQIGYGFCLDTGYRKRIRQAFGKVAATTVASSETREAAIRAGANPDAIQIIPNGVDLSRFTGSTAASESFRAKYGLGETKLVSCVGNLTPRKGVDSVIRAFDTVANCAPNLTLVIAGDGPERMRLEHLARSLPAAGSIRFLGAVDRQDMPGLFASTHIFVHAALAEGFGNVVLEAMASGCAVVVTATGAGRDIVTDADNGFVVCPGDTAQLAGKLRLLATNVALKDRLSLAASQVSHSFQLEKRSRAFRTLYDNLISGQPRWPR